MIASLIVKIFGAIFKIPLTNIIGVTAMAYFNTAYGFYVIFYMISTAGIPVALSKMISEAEARNDKQEIKNIFKISWLLFFALGVVGSSIMIAFSKKYSEYVHLDGLHFSIIAISTTLFFMCITSAYRGYFQGLKNMLPTAVSQIIGAIGKLFIGILVAVIATKCGYEPHVVAALTLLGITTGSIGSTIYLMIYKRICDRKEGSTVTRTSNVSSKNLLKKLISIAIPITLSATILSLTNTIDTTLMIRRLVHSGIIESDAQIIMGAYTSMAVPLNNLSPNLIYPFAISVMPVITGMFASGRKSDANTTITSMLRIVSIIAIPCSIGLATFAKPIVSILYSNKETIVVNGKSILATELSANMLSVLAISVFFISMVSVTNAVLQAYGYESKTIISTTIGIIAKIVLNYVLIGNAKTDIYGAPVATLSCYIIIMLINFHFIIKHTNYKPTIIPIIAKPLLAATVSIGMSAVIFYFISFINYKLIAIAMIFAAVLFYFALLFIVKGVENDDVKMLPKGEKIETFLKKLHLIK